MLPYITSPRCKAMPKLIAGCPAPLRLALIRVVAARAWVAAGKARPHAVSAPASSGKIASIASPDELQDFAARILHRLRHRPEIFVQQSDQRVARQCFRQLGEAAQIAQLNDGVNRLADAARNRTIEHATTRLAADIGIEQRARGASKRLDFEVHRQGRHHRLEHADVVFAKSLRVIGWQGNSLCAAVRKPCAEDDIVGDPGLPQIGKDRKQGPSFGCCGSQRTGPPPPRRRS